MKYYSIESSLNKKIMGKIPQAKGFVHHCNVWEDPNFIDKFIFEKIEIQPVLSNVVLHSKAQRTDLIDTFGDVGFNFSYLISNKLKEILEKFNIFGFQFFKTYVIQENEKLNDYWVINIFDFAFNYIDFAKTTFFIKNGLSRDITDEINISDLDHFLTKINVLKYPETIAISNIFFNEKMKLDLFSIRFHENGGQKGIISERLKNEIEKEGITGIEFKPIELSIYEWLMPGGEREKVYGKA
jgi:hypothetical protein